MRPIVPGAVVRYTGAPVFIRMWVYRVRNGYAWCRQMVDVFKIRHRCGNSEVWPIDDLERVP